MCTLTALHRSGIDLLRLGALLALLDATEGAEGGGSVTRLHCTPCRAQLVQGLSSSHCRIVSSSFQFIRRITCVTKAIDAPSRGGSCTVGTLAGSSCGPGAALRCYKPVKMRLKSLSRELAGLPSM